jgi:hypothetical protein
LFRALKIKIVLMTRQRNKILKIADRHGWDTANEYLDDPLADNNEDTFKLRGEVELWRFGCNSDKMSCFCLARAEFREVVNKDTASAVDISSPV